MNCGGDAIDAFVFVLSAVLDERIAIARDVYIVHLSSFIKPGIIL
jgi:hypothetical protein